MPGLEGWWAGLQARVQVGTVHCPPEVEVLTPRLPSVNLAPEGRGFFPAAPTGPGPPCCSPPHPRVQVEFYVNENTFKERLKLFFIKNQRSSE